MRVKIRAIGLLFSMVASLLVVPVQTASAQCALCRTALESSPEGQALAAGFNAAILFLLVAPFVIVSAGLIGAHPASPCLPGRPRTPPNPASLPRG